MAVKRSFLQSNFGVGRIGVIFLVAGLLIASAGVGVLLGYLISGTPIIGGGGILEVFDPPFGGEKRIRVLIIGEDETSDTNPEQRGLTDTIIVVSIDLESKHAAAISIPRDTRVDLGGYGTQSKINAAHVRGGSDLTAIAVERLIGIKPNYYIKIDLEGFQECVDAVGGVEIDVDRNMRYRDRRGGLHINLQKGPQLLDGEKAMHYVRFRQDAMGDITRIGRQQKFVKALMKKTLEPSNLPRLPQLVQTIFKNVDTNLNLKDAVHLAKVLSELDAEDIRMETLPGTPDVINGISYWIADGPKTHQVVRELFFPQPTLELPTVEVLNGSGIHGAAHNVAELLRRQGYEVALVGNADSFDYPSSLVISRCDDVKHIDRIASIVNSRSIRHEADPNAEVDVTVIVGRDCPLEGSGG